MWESESPFHIQVKIIQASNNHYADTNSGTGCLRVVEVYPTCLLQVKFLMDDQWLIWSLLEFLLIWYLWGNDNHEEAKHEEEHDNLERGDIASHPLQATHFLNLPLCCTQNFLASNKELVGEFDVFCEKSETHLFVSGLVKALEEVVRGLGDWRLLEDVRCTFSRSCKTSRTHYFVDNFSRAYTEPN